ncbi:uncharacterized protein BKA55DRAFT_579813 [Fusarium redolens]|jgi:hypothetical protein|uniref:DUF1907 domain-containing protein n=1 Tax=Fusarium redolens TaxID=48865 RepID=A0A9P9GBQ4_FUSRE|nr:uncharacterized protein BKA55DRAFT_579813 [Fusarium redolens]KAH7235029.1 hypothetical protein BKA55DRAFT_579813 [Fusarium redolens]
MRIEKFPLSPPSLEEVAAKLQAPLAANYEHSTVSVVSCPDLRQAPYYLATEGLSGDERIADVGGQPNLFPRPKMDCVWSMTELAEAMEMDPAKGGLLGAGAGPHHIVGHNCELAPNIGWQDSFENVKNESRYAKIDKETSAVHVDKSSSLDCALMINLFGSSGNPGPVIKITARKRTGSERSFAECIRKGLHQAYGEEQTVSLGGLFLVKKGKAKYHIMPDFPTEKNLPFKSRKDVDNWLTFHAFDAPMLCLSVLHSADPNGKMSLRVEHTHCYAADGKNSGGHYHYDLDDTEDDIEYEAYFNTAKTVYRLDRPT